VAVKSLREDLQNSEKRALLYREAWVTGRLEHPNIVPVYSLAEDEEGRLAFVMKRIEGVPWSKVLRRPEQFGELVRDDEPLTFHLRVFDTVCRAIHYAHARGVLHRDLKPSNVMLGSFGEVYVLDWGLAAALGSEPLGPLTSVAEIPTVEGTPQFIAPEMACADTQRIGIASDVYLLGAVLYLALTGRYRNPGKTPMDSLKAAFEGRAPHWDGTESPELRRIVDKATAKEPSGRFASVESLRTAVQTVLQHQTATRLAAEAKLRCDILDDMLAAEDVDPIAIARLSTEARFGLEQALREWPDHIEARASLDSLAAKMVHHEVAQEQPHTAAAWLEAWSNPDEAVAQEIGLLRERLAGRKKEVKELQRAVNTGVGAHRRAASSLWLGVLVVSFSLGTGLWESATNTRVSYGPPMLGTALYASTLAGTALRYRGRFTPVTLVQVGILVGGSLGLLGGLVTCWVMNVPIEAAMALLLVWSASQSAATATVTPTPVHLSVVGFLSGAVGIALVPAWCWWFVSLGLGLGFAGQWWAWSRG